MARMSPGREMKKYMDHPEKMGTDPEMDMKAKSSKRMIPKSGESRKPMMDDSEKRAAKVMGMMRGKRGSNPGY